MKLQAPVQLEMKVYITDGDSTGCVTYSFGQGTYPTAQQMHAAVDKCAETVKGNGYRLMTKKEFFNHIAPPCLDEDEDGEIVKISWATPGGEEWDK